jgi:hypothetical protein
MHLLGRYNKPLPSHSASEQRGTAVLVTLKPGAYAASAARFSPDVPGTGEPQNRQCEPTAYHVRATIPPDTGSVVAPVQPPTPVCEKGTMSMSVFVPGKNVPGH